MPYSPQRTAAMPGARRRRFGRLAVCGFVALVGGLALRVGELAAVAGPQRPSPGGTDSALNQGRAVYATNCAGCHGDRGDGQGPAARFLYPRPRNFGEAKFRIVTTDNGKPSDDDLMLVINHGMPGSAMFPFGHLPEGDKKALLTYLRELSREAFIEYARRQAEAAEEPVDMDELKQAAVTQLKPGAPLKIPVDLSPAGQASVERGARLFATGCAACHGTTGKGDGVQAQKNDDGTPTRPRDLTRGIFKGGRDPKQIYARIMVGMPGSPMPSSGPTLRPADGADLVNFLLSLSPPQSTERTQHRRTAVSARRVSGAVPADGAAAAWAAAAQPIVISPLWWRDHDDPGFEVAALHDGTTLAVRLSWRDPSRSAEVIRPEDFLDMAAVQLCGVRPEPFLGMGAAAGQVDLWLWRAGTPARPATVRGPLDVYPFEDPIPRSPANSAKPPDVLTARAAGNPNLTAGPTSNLAARGAGSTAFLPPASQLVAAQGAWADGRWTVVLRRPLRVPADGLSLQPGKSYSVAFGVWDGGHRDRNGQKFVSIWHDLKLEE